MYLSFYKLKRKPFQISTDPKFLWLGTKHQEAFSILRYGIEDDKGFLLLTGDVGTGKTTLLNAFVNSLDSDIIVARVSDPELKQLEFLKFIADKFRMNTEFNTKSEFLILFTQFLEDAYKKGKKVLLIIDEAQHLTDEILEQIRLLSNIEHQDKKLLNIFLVGQNEFISTIGKYKNRALRQRIAISYTLKPLEREETKTYIEHRLGVAGVQKHLFTPEAIDAIHTLSEGFPRVINIVCDLALFQGCQEKQNEISDEIIRVISKNFQFTQILQGSDEPDFDDTKEEDWCIEVEEVPSLSIEEFQGCQEKQNKNSDEKVSVISENIQSTQILQNSNKPGFDETRDEDWLIEVEEVPPLSIEEIHKATQPLPDLTLLSDEQDEKGSHKRGIALPLIFLTILLAGVFLIDQGHIDIIRQLFQSQSKDIVASPIEPKTSTNQLARPEKQTEVVAESVPVATTEAKETEHAEIIHLSDQKKFPPENPKPEAKEAEPTKEVTELPTKVAPVEEETVESDILVEPPPEKTAEKEEDPSSDQAESSPVPKGNENSEKPPQPPEEPLDSTAAEDPGAVIDWLIESKKSE